MTESDFDADLRKGLEYLRKSAIAAHRLGDGSLVSHLASSAIARVSNEASRIQDKRIFGERLLWAFVLGLYWTVDDIFSYLVDRGMRACPPEGIDPASRAMITMLNEIIRHPHSGHSWSSFIFPSHDTWQGSLAKDTQVERFLGYSLLIELAWYDDPKSDVWRNLLATCKSTCEHSDVVNDFQALNHRLSLQATLFDGQLSLESDTLTSLSELELELLRGWKHFFDFDHGKVNRLLSTGRLKIGIENSLYPNLFSLLHRTRFNDEHSEDQLVSLARYRYAVSRRPAHGVFERRERTAITAALQLAIANFPATSLPQERWTTFRMAMLIQLQALRNWDLGEWFRGLSIRGEARVELAKFNHHAMALEGFFDLLLSNGTTQLDKSDFRKQHFRLADLTTEDQRAEFVTRLLKLPKRYWSGVADLISSLSDAIPERSLPELVAWSVRVEEQTPIAGFGNLSFLDMWNDAIAFAIDPAAIGNALAPALINAARNPRLWKDLHHLFCYGILYCSHENAARLLSAINEAPHDSFFPDYCFSIAFNALKVKPELAYGALSVLRTAFAERPSPERWLILNKLVEGIDIPKPESATKESLRSRLLAFLKERSNLQGPTFTMVSTSFASEMAFYDWSESNVDLSDSLCAFINNDNTFYSDKDDLLRCLAILVKSGPANQGEQIVAFCLRSLCGPVPGRSFFGFMQLGPMSSFQVSGNTNEVLFALLLNVIQAGVHQNEELVTQSILEWLPTLDQADRATFASHITRLLFMLVFIHAPKDGSLALVLVGHVEAVFTAALTGDPAGSVLAFQDVLLGKERAEFWGRTKPTELWRRTLLAQWSNHLKRLSAHIDPDVRLATAQAVTKWIGLGLEFSQDLQPVFERLKQDPRSRVRRVILGAIEVDSSLGSG